MITCLGAVPCLQNVKKSWKTLVAISQSPSLGLHIALFVQQTKSKTVLNDEKEKQILIF